MSKKFPLVRLVIRLLVLVVLVVPLVPIQAASEAAASSAVMPAEETRTDTSSLTPPPVSSGIAPTEPLDVGEAALTAAEDEFFGPPSPWWKAFVPRAPVAEPVERENVPPRSDPQEISIERTNAAPIFLPPFSPLATFSPNQYVFAALSQGGVVRWNGTAWETRNGGLDGSALQVNQIAVDPFNPSTLLIATDGGVYRTTDALGSCDWSLSLTTPRPANSIEASPSVSGTYYAGVKAGPSYYDPIIFYTTTNAGGTWSQSSLPGGCAYCEPRDICLGTVGGEALYVFRPGLTSHEFWRSINNGHSWSRLQTLPGEAQSCATDPALDLVYAAGANNTGMFVVKSTNRGDSWTVIDPATPVKYRDVNVSPYDTSVWTTDYNNKRIYWSTDYGVSWISHTFPTTSTLVTAVDFGLPGEIWVGSNLSGSTTHVWQSTDGGTSWTNHKIMNLGNGNVQDIVPLGRYYYNLVDPALSLVVVDPNRLPADGQTTAAITVTVNDKFGNPIPGVWVELTSTGQGTVVTQPTAPTNTQGQTTGSIRDSRAEVVYVAARGAGIDLSNQALVTFVGPDLAVHKHAPAAASAGTSIVYTLWVTNSGLLAATEVVVTDTLPPYVQFVTQNAPYSWSQDGSDLVWQVGMLLPGEHASWQVTVIVDGNVPPWTPLVNQLEAYTPLPEHDTGNNVGSATTLAIYQLTANPRQLAMSTAPSSSTQHSILMHNGGQTTLHSLGVTLPTDTMPWLSANSYNLGDLGPGASVIFTLTAAPPQETEPGIRQGYVKIESTEGASRYVPLTVYVGSGVVGTLAFTVTDEIVPVPEAQVTIILPGDPATGLGNLVLENLTDEAGQVTFTNIPSGTYNYQIVASGYVSTWGQQEVHGGTQGVTEQLWSDYLDYEWTVTETVVTDVYDILLTITYQLPQVPHPIVVPCGPWKEIDMGGGGTAGGVLELRNPTGIDAEGVIISPNVEGIAMTIANNGHLGQVNGGGEVQIEFQVTGTNVPDDYEAGSFLVSGTFVSGTERVSFTHNINLLVNPTHDIDCHCVSDPEEYHAYCEVPEVPGGPGIDPPPFWPGWDPIQNPPQSQVHVRLSQQAVLTRQAFWGELTLSSKSADLTLLDLDLTILDGDGNDRTAEFVFNNSGASWIELPAHTSNKWHWTIIPGPCLGGEELTGKMYYVYVHVSFVANGQTYEFDTAQVGITVRPQPRVFLYYYLPYEIEAGQPFRVQIIAQDWGYGRAENLQMSVPTIELISNTTGFSLQVEGESDLDFGTIEPFQQALGHVDLKANQDAYVKKIAALLQHQDLQGLKVNPLILRASIYLVYTDSVQWITATELPDPGAWCAPQEPPPEPKLVRVWGWQEKVAALPGDMITHKYTVYNTSQSSPITVSLDMFSEHGWLMEGLASSPPLVIEPRRGVTVEVDLVVPEGTEYGTEDMGALEGYSILDPFMRDNDSTVTRVDSVKIVSIEVSPGTVLQRNADGWYEPNPIIYTVVIESELECSPVPTCWPGLLFEIRGSDRLQAIPLQHQFPGGEERTTGAFWDCRDGHCEEGIGTAPVTTGQHRISWEIQVQPETATRLITQAGIMWPDDPFSLVYVRAPDVWVPTASIHPVIVIPGALGTFPPANWGWLDPIEDTYDPINDYLEVLGYEPDVSLFGFPYNYFTSVPNDMSSLEEKITTIKGISGPAYVDRSKVDFVTHSLGGLVARAYIEREGFANDVNSLITLATPHQGMTGAYRAWEGNTFDWLMEELDWGLRSAAIIRGYCHWLQQIPYCTEEDVQNFIHGDLPSVRDVLPTEDVPTAYLVECTNPDNTYPVTANDPLGLGWPENPFLKDLNSPGGSYDLSHLIETPGLGVFAAYNNSYVTNQTFGVIDCFLPGACLGSGGIQNGTAPLWMHGIPSQCSAIQTTGLGDGMVLTYSAQINTIPGLESLVSTSVPGEHVLIPKKRATLLWLAQELTGVLPPSPGRWQIGEE